MQKVRYEHLTPAEFEHRLSQAPIAYLPLGTLEWHGLHLPLGADGLQSHGLFCALAQRVGGIVLPMLFLGPDLEKEVDGTAYYGMDFWARPEGEAPRQLPGSAYRISDGLYAQLLDGIMAQLARAGFKIVVAHGHGPSMNGFNAARAALQQKYGLTLMTAQFEDAPIGFQNDHAAANETSITMYYHPDLVNMANLPADLSVAPEGVAGDDPRIHASAELGRAAEEETLLRMEPLLRSALEKLQ